MTAWFRQFCIYVTDIERTIRFYETLGLSCTSRTKITEEISEAMIENPEKGGWIQLAQNSALGGPVTMGTSVWKLYVYTDDCQQVYDAAVEAGYKSVEPPRRLDRWPTTMAYIEDPDGYLIELLQRHEPMARVGDLRLNQCGLLAASDHPGRAGQRFADLGGTDVADVEIGVGHEVLVAARSDRRRGHGRIHQGGQEAALHDAGRVLHLRPRGHRPNRDAGFGLVHAAQAEPQVAVGRDTGFPGRHPSRVPAAVRRPPGGRPLLQTAPP